MSTNTIDTERTPTPQHGVPPKAKRTAKKARPTKKAARAKKPVGNQKAERANKKAEVIDMMKRAKGATLAEIVKATGWQQHTVRGFVSILGSKGGGEGRVLEDCCGRARYKIGK
jgi:hypothetical protein